MAVASMSHPAHSDASGSTSVAANKEPETFPILDRHTHDPTLVLDLGEREPWLQDRCPLSGFGAPDLAFAHRLRQIGPRPH